jgi:hypothetical protein
MQHTFQKGDRVYAILTDHNCNTVFEGTGVLVEEDEVAKKHWRIKFDKWGLINYWFYESYFYLTNEK